jgi:hypothetical protein
VLPAVACRPLAQRDIFIELGVRFEPIRNYPTLWSIAP